MNIEYDRVVAVVGAEGDQRGASALHGTLAGLLVGNPRQSGADVVAWMQASEELEFEYASDSDQLLDELVSAIRRGLDSDDLDFSLLMPDENTRFSDCSQALGQWCEGFLFGLGTSQVQDDTLIKEDIPEILADFEKISQVDGGTEDEQDEGLFIEVSEYVRVAVMLIYQQTRSEI